MLKKKLLIAAIILILISAALFFVFSGSSENFSSITVTATDFSESVLAVGKVRPHVSSELKAQVSGMVLQVDFQEGSPVSENDVIFVIDDSDQIFVVSQKQAAYNNALSQYQSLSTNLLPDARQKMLQAELEKNNAQNSYKNAGILFAEGAISESALQAAELEYQSALTTYDSAVRTYESMSGSGSLLAQKKSEMQSAKADYDKATSQLSKYQVTASQSGTLLKKYAEAGTYVQIGQALAEVGDLSSVYVAVDLDERYFPILKTGAKALVFIEETDRYEGSVSTISPFIDESTGTFSVNLQLEQNFPYKASDITVNVEIILAEPVDILTIPKTYAIQDGSGLYVWKYENGAIFKTQITVNSTLSNTLPIASGLAEGDILVTPDPKFKDGDRISIK